MIKRRVMGSVLAALLAALSTPAADSQSEWNQPGKKWIHGPVRCLITPDEEKAFKALKTEEELTAFVRDFWARRDPTPDTPANEFEEFISERVKEADKRFIQTTGSGALSDRGQVFLLLGMPTRVASGKNVEWIYENDPNVTPSSFTILFRQVGAGNLLLLGKKEFEGLIASNEFVRGIGPKAKEVFAPLPMVPENLPSALETAPPPEAVATEEAKILDSLAGSDLLPSALPVVVHADIYQATKGDSFVAVTLGVPRQEAGGGSLVGFARFIPEAADVRPVTLASSDSFAPAEAENADATSGMLVFQGGAGLHPGRYTLLTGMRNPESGKVGVVKQSLDVPKYEGGALILSTATLARSLAGPMAPPAVGEGKKPPFFLGSFRVVPSLDGVFKQGTDLAWYYQVYNAVPDPATGRPSLTTEYDLLLKQKGEYRPVAAPQIERNRPSQIAAFSFLLIKPTATQKGWVEGEYKVIIKVTDEVTKSTVTHELPFRVVP